MPPNILLIMADQLTPFMLRAYGDQTCRTPNLDRLAARGIVFDNAYSPCPLCAPARAAMMSGKFASHVDCYDNASVLSSAQPTAAHYLANAGYETVLSGKMHFIGPDQLHGFERRLTTDIYPAALSWIPFERDDTLLGGGEHAKLYKADAMGLRAWSVGLEYDGETLFEAQHFLRQRWLDKAGHGETSRPFFLCVSFHHPHEPFYVTQALWERYKDAAAALPADTVDIPRSVMDEWLNKQYHRTDKYPLTRDDLLLLRRCYYALVSDIDDKVGALLDTLDQVGEADNTAVIFTSDHGDMLGERGMVQKRCFYEWSARVPLIMVLPGGHAAEGAGAGTDTVAAGMCDARAGIRDARPCTLVDLLPTVLDIAGDGADPVDIDGHSLLRAPEEDAVAISEYHGEGVRAPCFMAKNESYKLIYIHGFDGQLFDLETDPRETRDLWRDSAFAAARQRLTDTILQQFDPAAIAAHIEPDRARRRVVRAADAAAGRRYDYCPTVDGTRQYYREFTTVPDVKEE
ncbi:MAG: sulfatase-like hydrolase/transferase [Oscillospiraceae bacterium]|nr:sulfatase-like hydrolase/transferase [Oscillospiraceae bacterium]